MLNNQPDTFSGINLLGLPILREKSGAIFFRIAAANPHFPMTSRLSRKTPLYPVLTPLYWKLAECLSVTLAL
jgi:hypothetical protein